MTEKSKIEWALLLLRYGVFIVLFMWTLDKFVHPEHASKVFEKYYKMDVAVSIMSIVGAAQLILVLAFVAGLCKRFTYGIVIVLHGVSTLSAWQKYATPFEQTNLLFFAAWPMLAACIALYLLRDLDKKWTLGK